MDLNDFLEEASASGLVAGSALHDMVRTWARLDDPTFETVWDRIEDGLLSSMPDQLGLHVRPGGWVLDLRESAARAVLGAALIGGLLAPAGIDQLPGYVLPAVIPLIVDVRRARLTRADRRLLLELRLSQSAVDLARPWPPGAFYSRLPAQVQARVSLEDFGDFLDALVRSGEADGMDLGEVRLRDPGDPAWLRVSLG